MTTSDARKRNTERRMNEARTVDPDLPDHFELPETVSVQGTPPAPDAMSWPRRDKDWPWVHPSGGHSTAPVGEMALQCRDCLEIFAQAAERARLDTVAFDGLPNRGAPIVAEEVPCEECAPSEPNPGPFRKVTGLTIDGIEIPPRKVLRDGFRVDADRNRVTMTMLYDQIDVTYRDDQNVRPLPTEPGAVIRAEIIDRPDLGRRVLERPKVDDVNLEGHWRIGSYVYPDQVIAPGWVRLVEETQP